MHPAKKEVRFRRPTEVRDVILEALRLAISGPDLPRGKVPDTATGFTRRPEPASKPVAIATDPGGAERVNPPPAPVLTAATQIQMDWTPATHSEEKPPVSPSSAPWGEYRLLGRVGGMYVVLETTEGLVLMDSRSAHERVLYERFLGAVEQGTVPSQGLLPPLTVPVTPSQGQALRKHLDILKRMGFGVAEFGADTFMVDALPAWVKDVAAGPLLSDIADGLMQGGKGAAKDWAQPLIATIAGRQAVGLQRELTESEVHALIQDLARTEMPYTSPRGKPTVILMSFRELNRKFGRD